MKHKRAIIWFRNDLRLHDNEALVEALRNADEIIPIYVIDERVFGGKTSFGFPKMGKFRQRFIFESLENLRQNLRQLGSELYVRIGKPEDVVFEIARQAKSSWVYCNRERTDEEVRIQDQLEQKLWSIGQELRFCRGKMLYHTADLPFPVNHTPETFSQYRKEVERITPIREPFATPQYLPQTSFDLAVGDIPTLSTFGFSDFEHDERAVLPFKGGETEGLKRLKYYLWDSDLVKTYEETRNGLIGGDYSSKFSAYLSTGCLSPKMIYHELKKYESARGDNRSTYWLFFELLWRDYFRLIGKKHEKSIFKLGGITGKPDKKWRADERVFNIWAEGKTGIPFIDANMRELNTTGFMSNRGRQNVASFLIKDLNINWLMGAEWFESQLIDYDPCSNYVNWMYIAGVGNDPREDRYFNILTQASRYDTRGDYVKLWLPELQKVSVEKIHRPDMLTEEEQMSCCLKLGVNYPKAMISSSKWLKF
ncbi:MAG: DASH family cryptochrome [Saprospiraceae bacterium]|nr:DASH family cryptochrome [Saprospiraceae bacterium]